MPRGKQVFGGRMRSFDEFCADFRVTAIERMELAHYLGSLRYKRTVQSLTSPEAMADAERRDMLSVLRQAT